MKLLFDQNLSPRLVRLLVNDFPGSTHTHLVGLDQADDLLVWAFALERDLTIVTKDADFRDLAVLRGTPPKVVWLRTGNCTTDEVAALLRGHRDEINDLTTNETLRTLILTSVTASGSLH